MLKYFKLSFIITIIGLICAYFWGEYRNPGSGFLALFVVCVLSILEVSLSFDNAVVNAMKLEKMTKEWQHRFLTWGIIIAVFGMRLLFPILIVSIFANLSLWETAKITLTDVDKYTHYLHLTHAPVLFFGAAFLMMLFFHYFFNHEKQTHWFSFIEKPMAKIGNIEGIETALTLGTMFVAQSFMPEPARLPVMLSGLSGVILYIVIHGLSQFMEQHAPQSNLTCAKQSFKAGLIAFLYLELIDASFSLDGVLGAFALSKDVIIITIGLAIGAMFVRSFTIMLVDKKTLEQYIYLEHGAHWAIGVLAIIMFITPIKEIPEVVTGVVGLVLIIGAFISSVLHNKRKIQNQ